MIATEYLAEKKLPSGITYHGVQKKDSLIRIILIHGMWGTSKLWLLLLQILQDLGIEVFAIDLPYHGNSVNKHSYRAGRNLGNSRLSEYVDDIIRAIAEIQNRYGEKDFVLVGHSMGGRIAQEVGAKILTTWLTTHSFKGIVLLASAPPEGILLGGLKLNLRIPLYFYKMYRGAFSLSESDEKTLMRNEEKEMWWETAEYDMPAQKESGRVAFDIIEGQLKFLFGWMFPVSDLSVLRSVKMMIIAGEKDEMISPSTSIAIMRRYPHSEKQWAGGDHFFPFEAEYGRELAATLLSWLGEINPEYVRLEV